MIVEQLFQEDINRKINGVVKVDQDADDVLIQELDEYVITKDLKKHFISFFNNYSQSYNERTSDIGVWISGFFGSGKSHFLKILSYLLANKEVQGVRTVERFRKKFADDPATFMLIDSVSKGHTDTILFNIDIEGFSIKDKTAVLRVFAKMFYNYLGFYGEDLKVAKLEQFLEKQGKTEDFRRVFQEVHERSWLESRDSYAFFEDDVVYTLKKVLGMSHQAATNWYNGSENIEISIAQLVSEIKDYVDSKPDDFRLLFMADEVGQYVGGDTDLLINLQSLVEKIGSECMGKVWVVCTGQEAIDEIIKARENEFSRIQARFKTRLSLTSSSADEVIQKRILKKKIEVEPALEEIYSKNESVLRNLFSFFNATLDIKGYTGPQSFVKNYPFLPYQFIILQKVFAEIRKHGNSGTHLSGGERSMLSGFQEAAQKIKDKDTNTLAPFYLFYDTVHSFLDSSIRSVIERCQKAADNGDGIENQDVDVLKLLYLIRYIDDIPANLDNIVILMADNIGLDKINMRESIRTSLDRLYSQNYIGRAGETYNFLTDEEQDVQREIYRNTQVDTSAIVERIGQLIFGDIYTNKKFRLGKYDFPFDQMVDNTNIGSVTGSMKLRIISVAADSLDLDRLTLYSESTSNQALVVLDDTPYFDCLEKAMKVRKYVKQRNISQLSSSVQEIIRHHQEEARKYEESAKEDLEKAIVNAQFYIGGEKIDINKGSAKEMLDSALSYLVTDVYKDLDLINKNVETEGEILDVLKGLDNNTLIEGLRPNHDAAVKMEEYLIMQANRGLPTSMADIQSRYQAIPYGWREIDISYVVAMLIYDQKVTIKYGGQIIQKNDPKLVDMLRKKSEIGRSLIQKRQEIAANKIRKVKEIVRDYFDIMDLPEDEDGLVRFIVEKFEEEKSRYKSLEARYNGQNYPDYNLLQKAIKTIDGIISQGMDNIALIEKISSEEDKIFDLKEDMEGLEAFFKNQVEIFDKAVKLEKDLYNDTEYIKKIEQANDALNQIRKITQIDVIQNSNYHRIPELNDLMTKVKDGHEKLLKEKREEIFEIIRQCLEQIHTMAIETPKAKQISNEYDRFFENQKQTINNTHSLQLLDGLITRLWKNKDNAIGKIEAIKKAEKQKLEQKEPREQIENPKLKNISKVYIQMIFPSKTLENPQELDKYLEDARKKIEQMMEDSDGVRLI